MREYLELSCVPCAENCAQVGEDNYTEKAKKECRAYINQLKRLHPKANFCIKSFEHDFGRYYEVVVYYVDGEESEEVAYEVENNLPEFWDDEAKAELGI